MSPCFNYYLDNECIFIRSLAQAFCMAIDENIYKLSQEYPAIAAAKSIGNWDKEPSERFKGVCYNENDIPKRKKHPKTTRMPWQGSFWWYLNHSGSFVTTIANIIMIADKKNLEKIMAIYPQMVAAFECDNWSFPPEGFDRAEYDANVLFTIQSCNNNIE